MSSKPAGRKAAKAAPARADSRSSGRQPRRRLPFVLQKKLDDFIEWLARTGSVSAAAEAAGLARTQVYERRRTHKRFAQAWSKALSLGVDGLHDKAMNRAMEGDERPKERQQRPRCLNHCLDSKRGVGSAGPKGSNGELAD